MKVQIRTVHSEGSNSFELNSIGFLVVDDKENMNIFYLSYFSAPQFILDGSHCTQYSIELLSRRTTLSSSC